MVLDRFRRMDDDAGMALVTVVGSMMVLTALALAALTYAVQSLPGSRRAQDAVTATAAAQAGIDDYISRLNVNSVYYGINGTGVDATNPAFGAGAPIPGGVSSGATFRYRLLTTPLQTAGNGVVRLRSTGTSKGVSRTLTARLSQDGLLRYVYFTDLESLDPSYYDTGSVRASVNGDYSDDSSGVNHIFYADKSQVETICATPYYAGRGSPTYTSSASRPYVDYNTRTGARVNGTAAKTIRFRCAEIQFTGNDIIRGPLHSNDALLVNGPVQFRSPRTETSWLQAGTSPPACGPCWWTTKGASPAVNTPVYAPSIELPKTNSKLLSYADTVGCHYRGQTRITFTGNTMKVLSPQTRSAPARCLDIARRGDEQTVNIPSIIYVEDVDETTTACTGGVGYPRRDEVVTPRITTEYNCRYGNAFLSGVVNAQVTVATSRDVVVTDDLTYQNGTSGTDVLGLLPNGSVWVYNPIDSAGRNLVGVGESVHRIDAAILTLQHSFIVQNWGRGTDRSPGSTVANKLIVTGAILQKHRGTVGARAAKQNGDDEDDEFRDTGYDKHYIYDARLRYLPPPFFFAPEDSPWRLRQLSDG